MITRQKMPGLSNTSSLAWLRVERKQQAANGGRIMDLATAQTDTVIALFTKRGDE